MTKRYIDSYILPFSLGFITLVGTISVLIGHESGIPFMVALPLLYVSFHGNLKDWIVLSIAGIIVFVTSMTLGFSGNLLYSSCSLVAFVVLMLASYPIGTETSSETREDIIDEANDWELGSHLDADILDEIGSPATLLGSEVQTFAREGQSSGKRLLQLETKFKALDQIALIAISNLSGELCYFNENFARISKFDSHELMGQNHRIQKSGKHPDGYFDELRKQISANQVWHGEICNKAKDGSFYWMDTIVSPIETEINFTTKYMAFGIDITHLKEKQERKQAGFLRAFSRNLVEKNTLLQEEIAHLERNASQSIDDCKKSLTKPCKERWSTLIDQAMKQRLRLSLPEPIEDGAFFYWSSDSSPILQMAVARYCEDLCTFSYEDQACLSDFLHTQMLERDDLLSVDILVRVNKTFPGVEMLIASYDQSEQSFIIMANQPLLVSVGSDSDSYYEAFDKVKLNTSRGQCCTCKLDPDHGYGFSISTSSCV